MKVSYIHHSGFVVETPRYSVIIDYYRDPKNIIPSIIDKSERIYVLVSHVHPDHYNEEIFEWYAGKDVIYILSNDIRKKFGKKIQERYADAQIYYLHEGEIYKDDNIVVKAFGSTDVGISFYINIEGKEMFHAGDLNNWHWKMESTENEIKKSEGDFNAVLQKIYAENKHFFLVMFPVDPRLGKDYAKGAWQFVHKIKVDNFMPMHMWGDWNAACDFSLYANAEYGNYICMQDGEAIELK